MVVGIKKRAIGIGMMLVLTAFVGIAANVSAENLPPVAEAGGPYAGYECHEMRFNAAGSYDPEGAQLTYQWYIKGVWVPFMPTTDIEYDYLWQNDFSGEVTLRVSDGDLTATDTASVTVLNVPPVITNVTGPTEIAMGEEASFSVTFYDGFMDPTRGLIASLDNHTAYFDFGDGTVLQFLLAPQVFSVDASNMYLAPGIYQIVITIVDDHGAMDSAVWNLTVVGNLPQVEAGPDASIDEGSTFMSNGYFIKTEEGVYTATVDYGDGSGPQPLSLNAAYMFNLSHQYFETGLYTVVVSILKDNSSYVSDSALVTVMNVAPTAMLVNDGPKDEGSPATIWFTDQYDPGILDTFTYSFDWNNDGVYEISNQASVSMIYTWYDNGMYTVKGKIQDDDGGFTEYSTVVIVNNVPPTITSLTGPVDPVLLGVPISLVGVFTDPGILDSHVALISWGDGLSTTVNLAAGVYQVSGSHTYGSAGVYTITLTVTDDDGGSDSKSIEVTVAEPVVFTVDAGPDGVIDEGSSFVSAGSFVGSAGDVFTGIVDYGDGSGPQPLALSPDYTFVLSHRYVEDGAYTVVVTVFKEGGASASDSAMVTVNNVPPVATLMNDGPKDEGSPATIWFTDQYDPGILDTFTYSFDWNNDGVYEISNQASVSMIYTWYDNGMYTVKGKIQDDDGGFTEYSTVVIVNNVPPTITSLTGPVDPVLLGTSITFNGLFTDPGILDSHVALISWDDGLSTTINLSAGVYQVSKSHTYGNIGVYTITLTVTDDDGGSDSKSIESYVVIYNPNGGFITGGGWLMSPQGSYPANPTLSGRVNFGFVSKYKKGQVVPEGNTEFQFQLADINFHSHVYEWLIIVGAKATYLGEGTINGQGHYGFRLTAIDGKISGGGGVDKFRMKIWDEDNNDQIVYDTDYGAPDIQDPSVALSGGQITIHKV